MGFVNLIFYIMKKLKSNLFEKFENEAIKTPSEILGGQTWHYMTSERSETYIGKDGDHITNTDDNHGNSKWQKIRFH